jgi:hypothetical protein
MDGLVSSKRVQQYMKEYGSSVQSSGRQELKLVESTQNHSDAREAEVIAEGLEFIKRHFKIEEYNRRIVEIRLSDMKKYKRIKPKKYTMKKKASKKSATISKARTLEGRAIEVANSIRTSNRIDESHLRPSSKLKDERDQFNLQSTNSSDEIRASNNPGLKREQIVKDCQPGTYEVVSIYKNHNEGGSGTRRLGGAQGPSIRNRSIQGNTLGANAGMDSVLDRMNQLDDSVDPSNPYRMADPFASKQNAKLGDGVNASAFNNFANKYFPDASVFKPESSKPAIPQKLHLGAKLNRTKTEQFESSMSSNLPIYKPQYQPIAQPQISQAYRDQSIKTGGIEARNQKFDEEELSILLDERYQALESKPLLQGGMALDDSMISDLNNLNSLLKQKPKYY